MNRNRGNRLQNCLWIFLFCYLLPAGLAHAQWSINGSNIYFNGGNVGIGTTTPQNLLDVGSGAIGTFTGNVISVSSSTAKSTVGVGQDPADRGRMSWIYNPTPANAYLAVGDSNGTHPLVLQDQGGNVGIGTTNPISKFAVALDTSVTGAITTQAGLGSNIITLQGPGGALNSKGGVVVSWSGAGSGIASGLVFGRYGGGWGTYIGFHAHSDNTNTIDDFPELMRIQGNGNVGIGIANPYYKLDLAAVALDSAGGALRFGNTQRDNLGDLYPTKIAYNITAPSPTASSLNFYVANGNAGGATESARQILAMPINGNGNVGIGTTSPQAKLDVAGNINVSGNISAKYQDLDEWVPSSEKIQSGYVVIVDPKQSGNVLPSSEAYDTRVAGVVSETPGIVLGEGGSNKVKVATVGRVKVRVDATHNPIQIGDLLVTSGSAGTAMKSEPVDVGGIKLHRPGTLIGKALEPLDSGVGVITVLLSLQ